MNSRAKISVAIAAAFAVACGQPAAAAIKVIDFTVHSESWVHINGVVGPFGLPLQPTLVGAVEIDDTKTGAAGFVGLNFKTGTRTWTLADIQPFSGIYYFGGSFDAFYMGLGTEGSGLGTNNTAVIAEGPNTLYCNGCVTVDSIRDAVSGGVPEPSTWVLSIVGFGSAGAMIRRRRLLGA